MLEKEKKCGEWHRDALHVREVGWPIVVEVGLEDACWGGRYHLSWKNNPLINCCLIWFRERKRVSIYVWVWIRKRFVVTQKLSFITYLCSQHFWSGACTWVFLKSGFDVFSILNLLIINTNQCQCVSAAFCRKCESVLSWPWAHGNSKVNGLSTSQSQWYEARTQINITLR